MKVITEADDAVRYLEALCMGYKQESFFEWGGAVRK